jgi:hypothetical protein
MGDLAGGEARDGAVDDRRRPLRVAACRHEGHLSVKVRPEPGLRSKALSPLAAEMQAMPMQDDTENADRETPGRPPLSAAASRALAEAEARRQAIDAKATEIAAARERQGRGGLEPVRYDDWEIKGIAVDF